MCILVLYTSKLVFIAVICKMRFLPSMRNKTHKLYNMSKKCINTFFMRILS